MGIAAAQRGLLSTGGGGASGATGGGLGATGLGAKGVAGLVGDAGVSGLAGISGAGATGVTGGSARSDRVISPAATQSLVTSNCSGDLAWAGRLTTRSGPLASSS